MKMRNNLMDAFNLFKIQGFETAEEMFLIGYIMAHGGELYFLEQVKNDFDLLSLNPTFWREIVDDCHDGRLKVAKEAVQNAEKLLVELLEKRDARIPDWLLDKMKVNKTKES